jgi:hypothetical protein
MSDWPCNLPPQVCESLGMSVEYPIASMSAASRAAGAGPSDFSARKSCRTIGRFTDFPALECSFGRTVASGASRSRAAGGDKPGGCPRPSGLAGREWHRNLIRIFAKKCEAIFVRI